MRRFLAATDGSSYGEHAVGVARALAQLAGGEFRELSVVDSVAVPAPVPGWSAQAEAAGRTATRNGGLPAVEIVRHAETWGADLVVLGRRPRSPGQPRPLGSASDGVIRRGRGLSLFVPPDVQLVRRAVLAVDGSLRGLGAVAPAAAFLNLTGARASAICVLPGPSLAGDLAIRSDARGVRAAGVLDQLQLDSGPCDLVMRQGDPVHEILEALRSSGADLLILGVRRGGQRGDSGSGYVGRELLKSAATAVLTVPI